MATHSSVLALRIPGMGEPGGLPSMGSHRVGHYWNDLAAAAGEWSHHRGYLGHEDLFCIVLLCILPPLLDISCFCSVHIISILYCSHLCKKCSLDISNFIEEISSLSHSYCFLILCIAHWGRFSYLFLLIFGTLHSDGYVFPFFLFLYLFFFSQLFVRPPQTTI